MADPKGRVRTVGTTLQYVHHKVTYGYVLNVRSIVPLIYIRS